MDDTVEISNTKLKSSISHRCSRIHTSRSIRTSLYIIASVK